MKSIFIITFSLLAALSFGQTNIATPDPANNGIPPQHTTYPPQPSTVITNPVDRGDINNNIRPDTTFLKGQGQDITPRQPNRPPNKDKRKKK